MLFQRPATPPTAATGLASLRLHPPRKFPPLPVSGSPFPGHQLFWVPHPAGLEADWLTLRAETWLAPGSPSLAQPPTSPARSCSPDPTPRQSPSCCSRDAEFGGRNQLYHQTHALPQHCSGIPRRRGTQKPGVGMRRGLRGEEGSLGAPLFPPGSCWGCPKKVNESQV